MSTPTPTPNINPVFQSFGVLPLPLSSSSSLPGNYTNDVTESPFFQAVAERNKSLQLQSPLASASSPLASAAIVGYIEEG